MKDLFSICENADKTVKMGIDEDGRLWMFRSSDGEWFDRQFDLEYRKIFNPCVFTAVNWVGDKFLLAGLEEGGGKRESAAVCYGSTDGAVWNVVDILCTTSTGIIAPNKKINVIFYDEKTGQTLLGGDGGQVIAINNCERCARVRYLEDAPICSFETAEGIHGVRNIYVYYSTGDVTVMNVWDLMQPRVDIEEGRRLLRNGIEFYCILEENEREAYAPRLKVITSVYGRTPEVINKKELLQLLERTPKSKTLLFVKDVHATFSRNCGHSNCYAISM